MRTKDEILDKAAKSSNPLGVIEGSKLEVLIDIRDILNRMVPIQQVPTSLIPKCDDCGGVLISDVPHSCITIKHHDHQLA
jgi:hypothetical protein